MFAEISNFMLELFKKWVLNLELSDYTLNTETRKFHRFVFIVNHNYREIYCAGRSLEHTEFFKSVPKS